MTYHNAVKYINTSPADREAPSLGAHVKQLWALLNQPQKNMKYLRLAGSSGKTVCAEMLTSAYAHSHLSVGCLLMPLRSDFRDNIRINHAPLPFDELASYVDRIHRLIKEINQGIAKRNRQREVEAREPDDPVGSELPVCLTRHEILLTAALLAFDAHHCKLCVIESDCTPSDPTKFLPPPLLLAICGTIPVLDRVETQQIRSYTCPGIQEMICAPQNQDDYRILSEICAKVNCRLTMPSRKEVELRSLSLTDSNFCYRGKQYRLKLCGKFQIENAVISLEILNALNRLGFPLSYEAISEGLLDTRLPCKFEILSVSPTIIADSTHDPAAIETVCDSLCEFHSLLGMKIHLCLPEGPLVNQYIRALSERGYEIGSVITLSAISVTEYIPPQKNYFQVKLIQETVKKAIASLRSEEALLLSGPFAFTAKIRYEFLKQLGF
ncbi:MAG: hypothetical protein IJY47_01315 [Clostridia bacterium]|nr:hypothetical protein [Clostridia bacterium]